MRLSRKHLGVLALALLLVTAGCSGAGGGSDSARQASGGGSNLEATAASDDANYDQSTAGDSAAERDTGDGSVTNVDSLASNRILIRTGTVTLRVDDYASARRNLTRSVRAQGGFVSDATQQVNGEENRTWTTGRVVLRVPSENFSAMFSDAETEGDVLDSTQSTQDVTEQVVDLRARLENLKAERDRLRTLYDRANGTEEVLAVGERLSDVQGEIERTEAKLRSLEERVAYSTITVELREPRPDYEPPEQTQWYDTGVVAAFLESVAGVGVVLRALVVGVAYALPYVLVASVPLVGIGLVVRRIR
ncbi:DUF4349 domain-containing protein [Salinirubrum litoreum]|uniref:DUF4349 domain-containing protein n=1 Tax=Salinirubrum litoreum TaxID=1126234 RepID=A0ABD5R7H1_9EURY|nr:DUF4349 domain-containing protein [Salinirubrum litoreum]